MAFRPVDFVFLCKLRIENGSLLPVQEGVATNEVLSLSPSSVKSPSEIAGTRWHMEVKDIYPDSRCLGADLAQIVTGMAPLIYQRGGFIYSDLTWAVAAKAPKIRQFVLTTSDYCKLYVTCVVFHTRVLSISVPVECGGEEFLHIPLAFGMISRAPYLTFPKLFLSHLCHACSDPVGLKSRLIQSISSLVHGVPLPHGSNSLSMWNLPSLEDSYNELLLYMGEVGIKGTAGEENHPVQSTYARSFTEVDLVALFDVLSVDVIVSVFNALLQEQKVLLISSKWPASFIAHLCEAFRVLLYPFDWQHVYIPLIPTCDSADDENFFPFWLSSATGPEHVHPLRFLEVPAPLFGGLKIRKRPITSHLSDYFAEKFPSLNLVDIDNDILYPARTRIDQVDTPLPHFPRKLLQLISLRLAPIADDLRSKTRISRYMNWDRIVPREIFSNVSIPDMTTAATNDKRRNSSSSSSASGGVVDSQGRRRSLIRRGRSSFVTPQSSMVVVSSGTWLGGFSSLFRTQTRTSRGTVLSSSSSRVSSADLSDVPFEYTNEDDPSSVSDFELVATTLIQSAFVEAFVRIFFAYRDFLVFEAEQPTDGGEKKNQLPHFDGAERHFQIRQFIKCVERHGIFGTDSMAFIKTFITTQSWDIFIRTTALTETGHLFDTACAFYCTANKLEYTKFKQVNMSLIIQATTSEVYAELPAAVEKELELLQPCPVGIKPKEFFFDELKTLILRLRREINHVTVVAATPVHIQDDDGSNNPSSSVVGIIEHVVSSALPNMYQNDPNLEAVKFANISNSSSSSPIIEMSEFVQLVLQVFSELSDDGKDNRHRHILHSILKGKIRQHNICPSIPVMEESSDPPTTPPPTNNGTSSTGMLMSALWSYKRSPLFRAFSVTGPDEMEFGKKILGGIPKSAANVPVPAVSAYLMRNWSLVGSGDLRFIVSASDLAGIDFACRNCGACKSFDTILIEGKFFSNPSSRVVASVCVQCSHTVHIHLIPSSNRHSVLLESFEAIVESLLELPMTFSTFLNLQFLMGLNVEVYTASDTSKRELRGVVSLVEILADYATHLEVSTPQSDSKIVLVEQEEVGNEKEEEVVVSLPERNGEMTPRTKARMRIREYKMKEKLKSGSVVPVIRINVDRSVSPPPGKPGNLTIFRRRISIGKNPRSSPQISSPALSPPAPPSERRPAESAPRRTHRRSSEFSKP